MSRRKPGQRYPSDGKPRVRRPSDAVWTQRRSAERAARRGDVGLPPGAVRLAAFRRRQAAGQRAIPYECPRCYERCHDPLGHQTDTQCLGALDNAAHRAWREREMEHRAAILDQPQSPG